MVSVRWVHAIVMATGLAACTLAPDLSVPTEPIADYPFDTANYSMRGFSFVLDGRLAGMPRPGSGAPLEKDLAFLAEQRIEVLVSLTEAGVDPAVASEHDITVVHLPVLDFTAPTQAQLYQFVETARTALAGGRAVGVHCGAGLGRTGTFLSTYFVADGMSASDAIAHVRSVRPGSVETVAQEQSVRDFADELARRAVESRTTR